MMPDRGSSAGRSLALLHPVFLLTGVLHAMGGPLLPSIAMTFSLNDSQCGLLFLLYSVGNSLGALLCTGRYARAMVIGFVVVVLCCSSIAFLPWPTLLVAFGCLGVGVGLPMSAVSLFVGRSFPTRSAPLLALLNFSWSLGALAAPLLAALILAHAGFRVAYVLLAACAVVAACACGLILEDVPEAASQQASLGTRNHLGVIAVFGLACFLQVGIESTATAWLSTYALRTTSSSAAFAAALSAFYWIGFLVSRAATPVVLLRIKAKILVRAAIPLALVVAILLVAAYNQVIAGAAMFFLGVMLAPIYPLMVAESFRHVRQTGDSRWILAAAGFGGSVLPWLTGSISAQSDNIRIGLLTVPAALLLMIFLLPLLFRSSAPPSSQALT